MAELIYDIFTSPNPIKVCVPFQPIKKTMNLLIDKRDYHSQCTLEFFLMLETIDLTNETFLTRSMINEMFNLSLLAQRTSEYAIMCMQFDQGLIGIKMDSADKLFQLTSILYTTASHIAKLTNRDVRPLTCTRTARKHVLAQTVQELIEKMFELLTNEELEVLKDKDPLNKRLAICNQTLNDMYVILK